MIHSRSFQINLIIGISIYGLTCSAGLPHLVLLSQYTSAAAPMIKVLCASQVYGSLIGNLCTHHVLFGKVPGSLK